MSALLAVLVAYLVAGLILTANVHASDTVLDWTANQTGALYRLLLLLILPWTLLLTAIQGTYKGEVRHSLLSWWKAFKRGSTN